MAAWEPIGTITVDGWSPAVTVGPLIVPPGTERILIRARSPSGRPVFPYGFGLLSWQSAAGREFGTARVYGHAEWEVIELPVSHEPTETAGVLIFEPRSYNNRWLVAEPSQLWTLEIEAMPVPAAAAPQGNRIVETGDAYVVWQDGSGRRWLDCWGTMTLGTNGLGTVVYPFPFVARPTLSVLAENDTAAGFILAPSVVTSTDWSRAQLTCWGYDVAAGAGAVWQRVGYGVRWRAVGRIASAATP